MWEPPWKRLVDELKDEGFESPYLDRLHHRLNIYLERPTLEQEILSEMAYALGRAEDKVNLALLQLDLKAREVAQTTHHEARRRLAEEHEDLRRRAKSVLRDLTIHREALGMRRHDLLHELYPIPPRLDEATVRAPRGPRMDDTG